MTNTSTSSASDEREGGCLCGAVGFRIRLPITACVHCHCTLCQRNHSAGHVTWIALPLEQLTIERGADQLIRYSSSEHGSRSFCGKCGTSILCQLEARPDEIDIPLACLTPGSGIEPQAHIHFDDRASWTRVGDELIQLGGKTGLEPIKD